MDIEIVQNLPKIDEEEINNAVQGYEKMQEEMREFNRNRKELLREFYDNVYPYQSMIDWLSYSNKPLSKVAACDNTYFNRREIAYIVLMDNNEDEYCTRHQCYKNVEEFKADVNKFVPLRIDIGAVFDYEPRINR